MKRAKRFHEDAAGLIQITDASSKAAKVTRTRLQEIADQAGMTLAPAAPKTLEQIYQEEDIPKAKPVQKTTVVREAAAAIEQPVPQPVEAIAPEILESRDFSVFHVELSRRHAA